MITEAEKGILRFLLDENGDKVIYNCGSDYWIASEFPSARDGSSSQTKKKTPTRVWRIKPYA